MITVTLTALAITGCGGPSSSVGPSSGTPSTPAASAPPAPNSPPPDPPSPSASPQVQTDPTLLDKAMLRPDQLPGWQRAPESGEAVNASTDPADCAMVYDQTVGKVAGGMGATVAYAQGPQTLQEYLDLVDDGRASVDQVQQTVARCHEITVNEQGEVSRYTVTPIPVPTLGDRSFGVRLSLAGPTPVDLRYVWVAHKDVVMMVHLEGPTVDQRLLDDATVRATDNLKATI